MSARASIVARWVALGLALAAPVATRPCAAACPPGKWFGPSLTYYTSPSPHAACLADLNGDGVLDLVTCSGAVLAAGVDNAVTVRLGRGTGGIGNGRFGAPHDYPAGVRPYHVVAADFDEDGAPDLAVANVGSGRVSVLRGLGGGTFAPPVSYAVGTSPFYLAAGDLNLDGILDLAVVNNGSSSVSVLLGNGAGDLGDGTFTVHGTYNVLGANPAAVEIGDFNHDGVPDLAVALYGGEVSVLRANEIGGVWAGGYLVAQKYFVGSGAFGLAQADLTEDGLPDLVTGNNGGKISVLVGQEIPGNDASMFTGLRTYPAGTSPGTVALADFDKDGRLDVVTVNSSVDSITVLLRSGGSGIGATSFGAPSSYKVSGFPIGLAVGDLNEDGNADVVTAGWNTHDVVVMLGACVSAPQPIAEPELHVPHDVPADEGGRVHLTWLASDFDANVTATVTSYRVWRRLPPGLFPKALPGSESVGPADAASLAPIARVDGTAVTYWEAIAVLPSSGAAQYDLDAATTRDSIAGDNPYTAFFVTAATNDPNVFYDSKPESAYSVDNLAPPAPSPFVAVYGADRATLHWGPSPAVDRSAYRIYRGPVATFVPAPDNRIAQVPDTGYVDLAPAAPTSCYKLTVVDVHGNEGPASLVTPPSLVGVPGDPAAGAVLRLSAASPSFGGRLLVSFSLATESPARLEAFDAAGRRVASLDAHGAGEHRAEIASGARLAAGVYVVRLVQDGRAIHAKVILLP